MLGNKKMMALIIFLVIIFLIPTYAYGMGRYVSILEDHFDAAEVKHNEGCNLRDGADHPRWPYSSGKNCTKECIRKAKEGIGAQAAFWPFLWPLRAVYERGKRKEKPILVHKPDDIDKAFKELEEYLK
jgi:hypothetical protein